MVTTLDRVKVVLALAAAALAVCIAILLASPSNANADCPYCGGWLGGGQTCFGALRWIDALYGTGAHHSMCIGTSNYTGTTSSAGPNQGTYNPLGPREWGHPWIYNQGWGNNWVGGYVYGP